MKIDTTLGIEACTNMLLYMLTQIKNKNLKYGYITCKWSGKLPDMIAAAQQAMKEPTITTIEIDRENITLRNNPDIYRTISLLPGLF